MAFTSTLVRRSVFGNRRVVISDINITSYTTGGEAVVPSTFGLTTLDHVQITTSGTSGFQAQYDHDAVPANNKLLVFTGGGQVAAATNVGFLRVIAYGN